MRRVGGDLFRVVMKEGAMGGTGRHRSKLEHRLPGAPQSNTQPGSTTPRQLRRFVAEGHGKLNAAAHEAQRRVRRMFQEEPEGKRPDPHIMSVEDVTKNLGLDQVTRERVHKVLRQVTSSYGAPREESLSMVRAPRINHARVYFMDVIRAMDHVDADTRLELERRAITYWRKFGKTDYERKPTMRHLVSKSRAADPTLRKADKDDDGEEQPKRSEPDAGDDDQEPEDKKSDKSKDDKDEDAPDVSMDVKDCEDGSCEIDFGEGVVAKLPAEVDYHHHIREHAKHVAGHEANKDSDPKKAEAHRHAANVHAKIANSLHEAGQYEEGPDPEELEALNGEEGDGPSQGGGDQGKGENGGQKGAQADEGPEGMGGKKLPAKPDKERNPPGKDSQRQAKKKKQEVQQKMGKSERYVTEPVPARFRIPYSVIGS